MIPQKFNNEFLIYQSDDGQIKIQVLLQDNTVWLTQADMVELFQSSKSNISEHIKHIFEEGELHEDSVVRKFRTTAADGKNYEVSHYNLDVIISVGYRVKSLRGTPFRIWATERLREYLIKGFTMNDDLLKQGGDSFVYLELKKYNQTFIEQIEEAQDTEALLQVWEQLKAKSFLNYNVDIKKQDEHIDEFKALILAEQKLHLCELLDKNQLYVNLSSLNDADFACTEEEKKVTQDFYLLKKK